uniref:Uncharacterized protein n=1 Tax=Tanacetum cinerariifolium TaxID=118510 RepID=A0A6L2K8D8_TANCI|nr:hypothetical protein [Tanacetum cinerariifolium]
MEQPDSLEAAPQSPIQTPPVPHDEDEPITSYFLPTAESPEYVAESDPEEDPDEYKDDESEDGPVDYPMEGRYDGDDDDSDSSRDDADDEDKKEEEHLAPTDSIVVVDNLIISIT